MRTKRAIRREVRDLIFNLTTLLGGGLGLLWAIQRPTPEPPSTCRPGRAGSDRVGDCLNDSLLSTLLPYVLAMGVGALIGAVLGALLARLVVRDTRRPATPSPSARWITARFEGICASCRTEVEPGDRILHEPGRTLCAACA